MAAALEQAMALHRLGLFDKAEAAYRRILESDPQNADALALLGCALSERKKHPEAVAAIEAALKLDPQAALFHFHLGNAQDKAGNPEKAEAAFARAIALKPDWDEAWYNLGNAQRALRKTGDAATSYERALKINPSHFLALNNLGAMLLKKGKPQEARKLFNAARALNPNHVQTLLNLTDAAFELNDLPAAFEAAQRAAEIKLGLDARAEGWLSRAGLFKNLDEEGINSFLTLATSLSLQGRLAESGAILRGLLAEEPDMAEAFSCLGVLALARNRLDAAEECYALCFALDPSGAPAPWNRAMVQLVRGDLHDGFRRYRWRWHALQKFRGLRLDGPMWDGRDLEGKTILLHEEQGYGDSLQMLRFAPLLKEKGARVLVYARPPLLPLIADWDAAGAHAWDGRKTVPEGVDVVCGVMDLPGLLGIGLETIPAKTPYLPNPRAGDPACTLEGKGKKIGLVWSGNPRHKRDHERSIPLEMFEPLVKSGAAAFYSLQYRPGAADRALLQKWGVTDLDPKIKDLADQAAFLNELDLLITVDTAPAHLAGALGIPVWVMVTSSPDWRWLLGRDDSPWYPSLRLFRQPESGNWNSVIASVNNAFPSLT